MSPGRTILISTHILEEVPSVCTRAIIIADGRILADATPAELLAQSRYAGALSVRAADTVAVRLALEGLEIGREHVRTPITNAQLVCRLLLEKKNYSHKLFTDTIKSPIFVS